MAAGKTRGRQPDYRPRGRKARARGPVRRHLNRALDHSGRPPAAAQRVMDIYNKAGGSLLAEGLAYSALFAGLTGLLLLRRPARLRRALIGRSAADHRRVLGRAGAIRADGPERPPMYRVERERIFGRGPRRPGLGHEPLLRRARSGIRPDLQPNEARGPSPRSCAASSRCSCSPADSSPAIAISALGAELRSPPSAREESSTGVRHVRVSGADGDGRRDCRRDRLPRGPEHPGPPLRPPAAGARGRRHHDPRRDARLYGPLLTGSLSLFGGVATVFAALAWLHLAFQVLLIGAAWTRIRLEDWEASRA